MQNAIQTNNMIKENKKKRKKITKIVHQKSSKNHYKIIQKSIKIVQKSNQTSIKIVQKSDPGGQPDQHRKNIEKPTPWDNFFGTHFASIFCKKPKKSVKKRHQKINENLTSKNPEFGRTWCENYTKLAPKSIPKSI